MKSVLPRQSWMKAEVSHEVTPARTDLRASFDAFLSGHFASFSHFHAFKMHSSDRHTQEHAQSDENIASARRGVAIEKKYSYNSAETRTRVKELFHQRFESDAYK